MIGFRKHILPIAIGVTVFGIMWFFFLSAPVEETAQMECIFEDSEQSGPVHIPYSQGRIDKIDYKAELTGKSVHDDITLWHSKGTASIGGASQELAGSVFLQSDKTVLGLNLYRERYPNETHDLRVSTLNENGRLDWDEDSVFVYFENSSVKLDHAFNYICTVTNGESQ